MSEQPETTFRYLGREYRWEEKHQIYCRELKCNGAKFDVPIYVCRVEAKSSWFLQVKTLAGKNEGRWFSDSKCCQVATARHSDGILFSLEEAKRALSEIVRNGKHQIAWKRSQSRRVSKKRTQTSSRKQTLRNNLLLKTAKSLDEKSDGVFATDIATRIIEANGKIQMRDTGPELKGIELKFLYYISLGNCIKNLIPLLQRSPSQIRNLRDRLVRRYSMKISYKGQQFSIHSWGYLGEQCGTLAIEEQNRHCNGS
jgi:hypothetical protein